MDKTITAQLARSLHHIRLLTPSSTSARASSVEESVYNQICKLVFKDQAYRELWDERILAQLNILFQVNPPEPTTYGQHVAEIGQRAQQTQKVNDLFFCILNQDTTAEEVLEALKPIFPPESSLLYRLKSSNRPQAIRKSDDPPSQKITAFLDFLKEEFGLDLLSREPVKGCLEALKGWQGTGVVNALLVRDNYLDALVIPLHIMLQAGNGQTHPAVQGSNEFRVAVERARLAMLSGRFLRPADDVVYSLELTEPFFKGNSICLAAAVGIYGAARGIIIDPYTAFTGDINLDQGYWRVQGVSGLPQKLEAAGLSGCRRVFIPSENIKEVNSSGQKSLHIIPVDDFLTVLLKLQAPLQPLSGDSLQIRKINALQSCCEAKGWDLSPPRPIQGGVQFRVVPLFPPDLSVSIYSSGLHTPKKHERPEYQELFKALQAQEESRIPIRKVEQKFNLQEPSLRTEIREALAYFQPVDQRKESHCEYMFRFERGQEHLVVKQYEKGTLQIQGTAGELYKDVLESIILRYNLRHPNAQLSVKVLLQSKETANAATSSQPLHSKSAQEVSLPHIGTDESGKGDYFGPMVIAGVFLDAQTKPKLAALGVKDSKLLSDKQCHELAVQIRQICRERFEEVEIPPETYNKLYEDFRKEGKNLNVLLAWGHARAIESLLERFLCSYAVADQFGDERYIISKLMEKGKQVKLVQLPKGERYIAIAAASILARDKFLARLEKLGQEYGIQLPKGSADIVVRAAKRIVERKGPEELRKVAKLHHKTTQKILG
jgi:ribonuclease HIII